LNDDTRSLHGEKFLTGMEILFSGYRSCYINGRQHARLAILSFGIRFASTVQVRKLDPIGKGHSGQEDDSRYNYRWNELVTDGRVKQPSTPDGYKGEISQLAGNASTF
jgi:hypothetical protein